MNEPQEQIIAPLTVFYSYAHEDEALRDTLEKHLSLLWRQGLIAEWHDRQIAPGTDWTQALDDHLRAASIILLLISPDFLASDYCYGVEMQHALARQQAGDARVIPILLRPVYWESAPFAHLACLPRDGKPVTTWTDRDEAFVDVTKGIRNVIEELSPASGMLQLSSQPVTPRALASSRQRAPFSSAPLDLNRQRMLKRIRSIWITGVLEQSLHGAALIALGLDEQYDVLDNPWRLVMQEVDQPAHTLPAGTHITEIYDKAEGELLILGESGAGKTTLLLELLRDLLDRAQGSKLDGIPVVFNLSSWVRKQAPLADWLVEELTIRYEVPRQLGQSWVRNEQLLLLLDGLDEVSSTARQECIQAINRYRQEHPLVPVVVSSRSDDYLNQPAQLRLHAAVIVQPLTQEQIDDYLISAGTQVEALRMALRTDLDLRELATTPLMLSILTLAYQGTPLDEITALDSLKTRRRQVFDSYVQRMLKRRSAGTHYTPQQTTQWLAWLAQQLVQHNRTEFYIERMQPDWIPKDISHWLYQSIAVKLVGGLVGGLFSALLGALLLGLLGNGPVFGLSYGLTVFGLSYGLIGVLVGVLTGRRETEIKPAEVIVWSWASMWRNLVKVDHLRNGLIIGLVGGLSYGLLDGLDTGLKGRMVAVLIEMLVDGLIGMLVGVLVGVLTGGREAEIKPAEVIVWSWASMWRNLVKVDHLRNGLFSGLVGGLGGGVVAAKLISKLSTTLVYGLVVRLVGVLIGGLIGWLMGGVISGLVSGLMGGLSSGRLDEHDLVTPNQGIWRSVRNSVLVGLVYALIGGLIGALVYGLVYVLIGGLTGGQARGLPSGLVGGILGGLLGWLIGWLLGGGDACIKHVVLRLLLWRTGSVPWNYPRFLDYAAERILLHKVGGGYIFIHRLLLEYLASCATSIQEKELPDGRV